MMNPGSKEAVRAGCTCPVQDNRYGHGAYFHQGKPVFILNEHCPIHTQGSCPMCGGNDANENIRGEE